jgi:hypothetical protein
MGFEIFQLTKENNKIDAFDNEQLVRKYSMQRAKSLKINLIETSGIKNPSSITIEIHQRGEVKKSYNHTG